VIPKCYQLIHRKLTTIPIISQINPLHSHNILPKISFHTTLLSTSRGAKWLLPFLRKPVLVSCFIFVIVKRRYSGNIQALQWVVPGIQNLCLFCFKCKILWGWPTAHQPPQTSFCTGLVIKLGEEKRNILATVHFLGGKAAGAWADNLTTSMCRMSWKSGSLNLLEPSGPHRACYGKALPLPLATVPRNNIYLFN
jgi:hypothetical protein